MKKALSLLLVIVILSFAGCTKNEDVHTVGEEYPLSVGGTVNISSRKPDTFNPLVTKYESCREILYLFYDPLFNVDSQYRITANLAENCIMADNGKRAVVSLRSGVRFSDGTMFTSEDVVYTVNFIKENGGIYLGSVKEIESVSAQNSTTVEFLLNKENINFCNVLTFPIIKRASEADMNAPIGTGQFYTNSDMISYTEIECMKNENYHLGRPFIDKFIIKYISTDLKAESSFLSGELDMLADYSFSDKLKEEDYKVYRLDKNMFEFLGFNCVGKLFSYDEVRRAVTTSIDIIAIERDFNYEYRTACDVPIHPSFYKYESDSESTTEQTSVSDILRNNGWGVNEHGIYEKENTELAFDIIVNLSDDQRVTVAELISKQLSGKGISAKIVKLEDEEYAKRIEEGNYDAFVGGVNIGNPVNLEFFCGSNGYANVFGYSGGVMDMRVEALKNAADSDLETETKKFIRTYRECIPAAGLYFKGKYMVADKDISIPWISPLSVYSTAYTWTTR